MPVDPDPAPNGNVEILRPGHCRVVTNRERNEAEAAGTFPYHTAHFATCKPAKR